MPEDANSALDLLEKQEQLKSGASWFKFAAPGVNFQGTLIARYRAESQLGQEQVVYVLKNEEGIFNVAFNVTYITIHRELKNAVVGQIVRFSYLEDKPHKVKGYHPIKIIRVFTRQDLLEGGADSWLAEYGVKSGDALPEVVEIPEDEDAPATSTADVPFGPSASAPKPMTGNSPST